jgi:hypothetical protein
MSTRPTPQATAKTEKAQAPTYTTPEGLRVLLLRLHIDGPNAWRTDPDATTLLEHCAAKYGALARRYRQEPLDAAAAAFEVLRAPATVEAMDPWAVVTHAVRLTLQANERADALLCSTDHARRVMADGDHDVVRFAERAEHSWIGELTPLGTARHSPGHGIPGLAGAISPFEVRLCVSNAVELLASLGWPRPVAHLGIEYMCRRLETAGSVERAFEYLRRDLVPPVLLDVPHRTWVTLCRVLLGPDDGPGPARGVLRRLLTGESVRSLLGDDAVVAVLDRVRPREIGTAS